MKAVWDIDYNSRTDSCYECPSCPKCRDPIYKSGNKFKCINCGKVVKISATMKEWFAEREGLKVEMHDCTKIRSIGCGCKNCVETYYRKNPASLEWEVVGGKCTECGMKFIV